MTDLSKLHPRLAGAIPKILNAMAALDHPMLVTATLRTSAEQAALFAAGRTAPGPIVTNADGVTKFSNHQAKADGFGHAADLCFLVDGKPSWDIHLPWRCYGECAKALGLKWGGDWQTFHDLPHIEI